MFSHKMQKDAKQFMPHLFIAFMVCTVTYHLMFFKTIQEVALEEECATQANAGGIISSQCLELELFKDWHKKGTDDLLVEAPAPAKEEPVAAASKSGKGMTAVIVDESGDTFHTIAGDLEGLEKQFSQLVVSGVHLDVKYDKEDARDHGDVNEDSKMLKLWERKEEERERFDKLENEVRASLEVTSETPWAHDLKDLMDHMQHELEDHHVVSHNDPIAKQLDHEALKAHTQAHIDKLESAVRAAQTSSDSAAPSPWARDVGLVKSRHAIKLAIHAGKFHASEDQRARLAKLEQSVNVTLDDSHDTPWAKDLKNLQHRLEFELHTHTHRHHDPVEAVDDAAHWGRTSSSKDNDPLARWASHVEGFHSTHEQFQARHKERVERRAQLTKDIEQRMEKLDHGLTNLISDRKAWESTFLEKHDVASFAAGQDAIPKTSFLSNQLKWSNVPTSIPMDVKGTDFLRGASPKQPIVVHKGDVRHLKWVGELPKVAAIAWIRGDRKTRARMTYFVDNFKLQDYEGQRELVFVYHSHDTEAAGILRQYANSTDVKVVAAHDFSQDAFPSDPALRFAAWGSDADVVAQWDFDGWHDPSRLSMQIRAMAHTAKHGCVLSMSSTSHGQEDDSKEVSLSSLVGTRAWMKAHWHPFSKRKLEVEDTLKAGQLVELDMQNKKMMNSISRVEHVYSSVRSENASQASQAAVAQGTNDVASQAAGRSKFSRDVDECLGYDHSHGQAADDAAEKAIRENIGPAFGKRFHDLVKKRHDITLKLQLLCFQTSMEKDPVKRKSMHDHVVELDHTRAKLDKSAHQIASVFHVDI